VAAGSFAKLTATPYSLQYTYTGGGSVDALPASTILADCAAGPLKNFLSNKNVVSGWAPSGAFAQAIRLYATQQTGASPSINGVEFTAGGSNALQVSSTGVCTALIEIVFKHSMER